MFEHKCHFKVKTKEDIDLEELELEFIDHGLSEVFEEEDHILMYGEFESYGPLQKHLEESGFEIVSSEFERIPAETKTLSAEQKEQIYKLLEKLEEDDDVTNVFHNMEE